MKHAVKEAYGDAAEWIGVERILAEIRDPASDRPDAARYFLNLPWSDDAQWITPAEWDACQVDEALEDGEEITVGFDGSRWEDETGFAAASLDGLVTLPGVWSPIGELGIDSALVDETVRDTHDRFHIRKGYADPPYWQDDISRWAADGIPFEEWWTNRKRKMVAALDRFRTAVRTRQLRHDGNPELRRAVLNCRVNRTWAGVEVRKEHQRSKKKIDAAIAAVLCWEARAVVIGSEAPKKKRAATRRRAIRG